MSITQQQINSIEDKISSEIVKLGIELNNKSGNDFIVLMEKLQATAAEGRALISTLETYLPI